MPNCIIMSSFVHHSLAPENHRVSLRRKSLQKILPSPGIHQFPYLSLARTASGGTLKTRATMAAGGDDTRKMMGDPYALGGFVPDRDRHGIKYCNIEFGTGKVTTKVGVGVLWDIWGMRKR